MIDAGSTADRPAVLIVDDEEGIRKLLTTVLTEKGYSTDSCVTGQEAIEKADERFYDIALIDIFLPDVSGVDLLERMRERRPRTRKIIMTGHPSLQNAVGALNRGADAYIMKPLDVEKVLATVKEQLEKQNEERAIVRAAFLNLILSETLDSCIRKRM